MGAKGHFGVFWGSQKTAEKKQTSGLALILDEPQRMKEKAETVETEFRESMSHRLEQGYILPGQADLFIFLKDSAGGLPYALTRSL